MRAVVAACMICVLAAEAACDRSYTRRGFLVVYEFREGAPSIVDTLPELDPDSLPNATRQAVGARLENPEEPLDTACNRYFGRRRGPYVISTESSCEGTDRSRSFFYAFTGEGAEVPALPATGRFNGPHFNTEGLAGEPTQKCPPRRRRGGRVDSHVISACPDWTMR